MYIRLLAAVLVAVPVGGAAQSVTAPLAVKDGTTVALSIPARDLVTQPFSKLFQGPVTLDVQGQRLPPVPDPSQPAVMRPRRRVVCGMTLILVDPGRVDPRMPRANPRPNMRYTMRNFPAPACRDK